MASVGNIPWNKGLTKFTDPRVAKNARATSKSKQGIHWKGDKRKISYNRGHSIPISKYNEMLESQKGVCAICGKPETRKYKGVICRMMIDHNHKTGVIRGLLCHRCNVALGLFLEDTNVLTKAINYLKEN